MICLSPYGKASLSLSIEISNVSSAFARYLRAEITWPDRICDFPTLPDSWINGDIHGRLGAMVGRSQRRQAVFTEAETGPVFPGHKFTVLGNIIIDAPAGKIAKETMDIEEEVGIVIFADAMDRKVLSLPIKSLAERL